MELDQRSLDVLADASGRDRFDGGRIIPDGKEESFVVRAVPEGGRALLRVRVDAGVKAIRARVRDRTTELELGPSRPGAWREATARVEGLGAGDAVVLEAAGGPYRDYHVWIEQP